MRAISTRIKEETGVGRLILPNDHVDVILTKRRAAARQRGSVSETLFRNMRVLAIGQLIEAKDGKKLAEGNTATLELTPRQAELLARSELRGRDLARLCAASPTWRPRTADGRQAQRLHQDHAGTERSRVAYGVN